MGIRFYKFLVGGIMFHANNFNLTPQETWLIFDIINLGFPKHVSRIPTCITSPGKKKKSVQINS